MIKINFSPVRSDNPEPNALSWAVPVLWVSGSPYDLSALPDGATAHHPVLGTVDRAGDDYEVTLILNHGAGASAEARFPDPIIVTEDGDVSLPPYDEPEANL